MLRPLTVLLLVPLLGGCAAVAAAGIVGVGALQYERNELEQDFPAELRETWEGTLEGLRALGIYPTLSELEPTEGVIEYRDLRVRVERHPEGFTRVRVRVGTFHTADHRRRAELALQEIERAMQGVDEVRAWSERVRGLSGTPPAEVPAEAPAEPDGTPPEPPLE